MRKLRSTRSPGHANTLLTKSSPKLNGASEGNAIITHLHIVCDRYTFECVCLCVFMCARTPAHMCTRDTRIMYRTHHAIYAVRGAVELPGWKRSVCTHMCSRAEDARLMRGSYYTIPDFGRAGPPPRSTSGRQAAGGGGSYLPLPPKPPRFAYVHALWRVSMCTIY